VAEFFTGLPEDTASPAFSTGVVSYLSGTRTAETHLGRIVERCFAMTASAFPFVTTGAVTRSAFERALTTTFAGEARAVVVDRTDYVLADHCRLPLVALRSSTGIGAKPEVEEAHVNLSHTGWLVISRSLTSTASIE
jgi:hypothetical protein